MRTVEDDAGRRYLLLKRSGESSLVRDLWTGEERFLPNERLADRAGIDPLLEAADALAELDRRRLPTLHDERAYGLLVLLARAPRSAKTLLSGTDLCESDLLGLATELRAAGLVVETTVDGDRGYAATDRVRAVVPDGEGPRDDRTPADRDAQSAGASSSRSSD